MNSKKEIPYLNNKIIPANKNKILINLEDDDEFPSLGQPQPKKK